LGAINLSVKAGELSPHDNIAIADEPNGAASSRIVAFRVNLQKLPEFLLT